MRKHNTCAKTQGVLYKFNAHAMACVGLRRQLQCMLWLWARHDSDYALLNLSIRLS
jgi:hypothetical protein